MALKPKHSRVLELESTTGSRVLVTDDMIRQIPKLSPQAPYAAFSIHFADPMSVLGFASTSAAFAEIFPALCQLPSSMLP